MSIWNNEKLSSKQKGAVKNNQEKEETKKNVF